MQNILVLNAGSSSVKFAFYKGSELLLKETIEEPHDAGFDKIFTLLDQKFPDIKIAAVGHRIVHGGDLFKIPVVINDDVLKKIESLSGLAPLHQPHGLAGIAKAKNKFPDAVQIACFDTSFHQTENKLARMLPLPRALYDEGVKRYGFHGLSYEYIAGVLPHYLNDKADGKIIVAHLGSGASLCAMQNRKSVMTTMGFTALDGLMMGERSGTIDPGVILYLLDAKKLSSRDISDLLYKKSGLLGVSGISGDVRTLLQSNKPEAHEAIDLFCVRIVQEIGALIATLQGCDALVFTAGIGEHAAPVRAQILERLAFMGFTLDPAANDGNGPQITTKESKITAFVIPTDEEIIIARAAENLLKTSS